MSDNNHTAPKTPAAKDRPHRSARWWRLAIYILSAVIIIPLVIICCALAYLRPERLTPLVRDLANQYLTADVQVQRVELSVISTFPFLEVSADSLVIISKSLPEATSNDTLLTVNRFHGGLNVLRLLTGEIRLHNLSLTGPSANLVALNDSVNNWSIVPPSEHKGRKKLPRISIDQFELIDSLTLRYQDVAEGTVARATVNRLKVDGSSLPEYSLNITGVLPVLAVPGYTVPPVSFGVSGLLVWDPANPDIFIAKGLTVGTKGAEVMLDTELDLSTEPTVNSLTLAAKADLPKLLELLPAEVNRGAGGLETDIHMEAKARLNAPYTLTDSILPDMATDLTIGGYVVYDGVRFDDLRADMQLNTDGRNREGNSLTIRNLTSTGRAFDGRLCGTVTSLLDDPHITGEFAGVVVLGNLPKRLMQATGMKLSGELTGTTAFDLTASDITPERFHRIKLTGRLTAHRLIAESDTAELRLDVPDGTVDFGTNLTYRNGAHKVDSLISLTVRLDTATLYAQGVRYTAGDMKISVATKASELRADTTAIIPVGARISAGSLAMRTPNGGDTLRAKARDVDASVILRRFENHARQPLLDLGIHTGRLVYADGVNLGMVSTMDAALNMHIRPPRDSKTGRRKHTGNAKDTTRQYVDFELSRPVLDLLRRTDARGHVTAGRGRLLSPYFPVRCRLEGLSLQFTTDSVALDSVSLRAGRSRLRADGYVANIVRGISSRGRSPFRIKFDVHSDTMDINELAEALFHGAAVRNRLTADAAAKDSLNRSAAIAAETGTVTADAQSTAADTERAAPLLPSNIQADINLTADNVLYSDIWFHQIQGTAHLQDGMMHLDRFAGFTPMGTIDLTALYNAPSADSLSMAAGLVVRQLQLHKFLKMMPQLDSLMPLLNDIGGIITTEMAMTTELEPNLDIRLPSLRAMVKLSGDSLVLMDSKTFSTIAKWLLFKHKDRNMIDHMAVQVAIRDSRLELYPFVFDFDRYRIGVAGGNDLDMNLDYHIAVLKSPIPFKFGLNIKGRPHHLRFSLGGAHFKENQAWDKRDLTDTARVNLLDEIREVFRFGVSSGRRNARLAVDAPLPTREYSVSDTLTPADSLFFRQQGIIE